MKKISLNELLLLLTGVIFLSYIILGGFNRQEPADSKELSGISALNSGIFKIIPLKIGDKSVQAFVADTPELFKRGLGGRESISGDEAMLFDFGQPDFYGIWMKDMKFSIDIFWLDDFKRVIFLQKNISLETYPKVFISDKKASYVIETEAGFAEKNQIKIGDEVYFSKID